MKKDVLLAFISLTWFVSLSAQTLDSISHHYVGWYGVAMENMIPLRNGTVLANCQLYTLDENHVHSVEDYGNRFLKIDPKSSAVCDSVFLEDHDLNYYLVERNPFDDDNIYACAVRDLDNLRTDLCIRFFDDQFAFRDEKELWVPLITDTVYYYCSDSYLLDKNGDIVLRFRVKTRREHHFFRIGVDGNVKAHSVYSYDDIPALYRLADRDLIVFNENPLEYAYYREASHQVLQIAVLDSLLVLKEDLVLATGSSQFGMDDQVRSLDNTSFLVASQYHSMDYQEDGVCIVKYDKASCQHLKTVYFPSECVSSELLGGAVPIDVQIGGNGDIYFAYHSALLSKTGHVVVVRMDHDLNVVWQRFCLEEGYLRLGSALQIMEDGTIAVGGVVSGETSTNNYGIMTGVSPPSFYFLFLNEDGLGIEENADILRPYTFYPNPVNDMLNIHYSPDAMPKKVEVFDPQGRMVLSQSNGLESIRMPELTSGVYTLRVTLESGESYTDKILKQ